MRDRINFLAPLSVQITVHKPAPRDIAALRRGPMTIEVGTDALRRGIRWDFDFLEFGVFERFVQPNGAPLCEAPLGPDETLAVHFTFQSTAGLGLGGGGRQAELRSKVRGDAEDCCNACGLSAKETRNWSIFPNFLETCVERHSEGIQPIRVLSSEFKVAAQRAKAA